MQNEAVEQRLPRTKTSRRSRRRLKPRRDASPSPDPTESVCTIEYVDGVPSHTRVIEVASPPRDFTSLLGLSWKNFLRDLKAGDIEQVCLINDVESVPRVINSIELNDASSRPNNAEPKSAREEHFAAQSWEALKASGNPVYETAREFADVFPDKIPAVLPAHRGVRHEIDLAPDAKYCVTRQWPLPRDQVQAIDVFFEGRRMRQPPVVGASPNAFNKLNDATIPAQTPIPLKDMVLDSMSGSVIFSSIDLTDGFYQTPPPCSIAWYPICFAHSATSRRVTSTTSLSTVELRMASAREGFVYLLVAYPTNPTELRQWLGLANYLHKYTKDYAGLTQPLSSLLKKDATWSWRPEHQTAFDSVKKSLASAPILMLPDGSKPFHVVCDTSEFAIGCALMQFDDEGHERIVSYQSRQMKPAERNYPVHDKEPLAMRYALIKFRVYLLGEQTFAVYTDHASLRTAMKSPHLTQLIDGEDDSDEHCAVCAASGINLTSVLPEMDLRDEIAAAYAHNAVYGNILAYLRSSSDETLGALSRNTRNQIDRYHLDGDLLRYNIDHFDAP
ncbi:unnamed protein product [Phytophthora fragariaefolia]|uniref:Unnamed protein product n=1 Tax=Phytophthora fragariaefolia TaxID=1490495 RepID=A0A9W6TZ94_9STRA|nr:unnamed protein product [Phytophthora fragariaefolia]